MNVGDRVVATGVIEASGELVVILPRGINQATPRFTHQVKLDTPHHGFWFLWFDPADLAPESTSGSGGASDAVRV